MLTCIHLFCTYTIHIEASLRTVDKANGDVSFDVTFLYIQIHACMHISAQALPKIPEGGIHVTHMFSLPEYHSRKPSHRVYGEKVCFLCIISLMWLKSLFHLVLLSMCVSIIAAFLYIIHINANMDRIPHWYHCIDQ